jgi:enolase
LSTGGYNTSELIEYYNNLIKGYPIIGIEDPLEENDWNGFKEKPKQ